MEALVDLAALPAAVGRTLRPGERCAAGRDVATPDATNGRRIDVERHAYEKLGDSSPEIGRATGRHSPRAMSPSLRWLQAWLPEDEELVAGGWLRGVGSYRGCVAGGHLALSCGASYKPLVC